MDVFVEHPKGQKWPCPVCGDLLPAYDHSEERVWRHLDSCQFQTFLHARPPRVQCPKDGVHQVRLPWAKPKARFTLLFERLAIDVMRVTNIQAALDKSCASAGARRGTFSSGPSSADCNVKSLGQSNIWASMRSRLPAASGTSPGLRPRPRHRRTHRGWPRQAQLRVLS